MAHRWQRVRLMDRLLLLSKAFNRASLKCGASLAFDSDPGGVPDIPGHGSMPSWSRKRTSSFSSSTASAPSSQQLARVVIKIGRQYIQKCGF